MQGHAALVFDESTMKVSETPVGPGFHMRIPFKEYPTVYNLAFTGM